MNKLFLLLGGNLGDRFDLLDQAKNSIIENVGEIRKESSIYETSPWGFNADQDFLNQVVIVSTTLFPTEVLHKCLRIENLLGRKRSSGNYSSRTMDIDILFYDDQIINEFDLIIPHKYLHERRFALEPLVELCPDFLHPKLHKTLKDILRNCKDESKVKKL